MNGWMIEMSPQLLKAYPQLATMVRGESPLAAALEAWASGGCITTITARDLAADRKLEK